MTGFETGGARWNGESQDFGVAHPFDPEGQEGVVVEPKDELLAADIMAAAVNNLENTTRNAEEGLVDGVAVDEVYDTTMRTIAELAFGECSYPTYCKFYGPNPSFCDRICGESVWDQI